MSRGDRRLVAAFPSELPRGTAWRTSTCGSREVWTEGPPAPPGTGELIVTGSCGALVPGIAPGRLVLPERLRRLDGGRLTPRGGLRAALAAAAAAAGVLVEGGGLLEVEAVVEGEAERAAQAQATGCRFADMESAALAAAAEAAGRPWAVLRFVSDGPEFPLAWLAELYGGFPVAEPGPLQTLAALARHPHHLGRLLSLGRRVAGGRAAVGRVLLALPS